MTGLCSGYFLQNKVRCASPCTFTRLARNWRVNGLGAPSPRLMCLAHLHTINYDGAELLLNCPLDQHVISCCIRRLERPGFIRKPLRSRPEKASMSS